MPDLFRPAHAAAPGFGHPITCHGSSQKRVEMPHTRKGLMALYVRMVPAATRMHRMRYIPVWTATCHPRCRARSSLTGSSGMQPRLKTLPGARSSSSGSLTTGSPAPEITLKGPFVVILLPETVTPTVAPVTTRLPEGLSGLPLLTVVLGSVASATFIASSLLVMRWFVHRHNKTI